MISAAKMLDPQQLLELWFQMSYEAGQEAGLRAEEKRREQQRVYPRQPGAAALLWTAGWTRRAGAPLKTPSTP